MTLWLLAICVTTVAQTTTKPAAAAQPTADTKAAAKAPPDPLRLPDADAKLLVNLSDQIEGMGKNVEAAQKQAEQAVKLLNEANAFIASYNKLIADRQAFIYRQAADVCGCKSDQIELAPDGKSIVKKAKP
jgi:prophage DNA circulation protein